MWLLLAALFACPKAPRRPNLQEATFEVAWGRIQETYPYADFKGLDWQAVHDELLPKAAAAKDAEALRPILTDMLSRLHESHFVVVPGFAAPSPADAAPQGPNDFGDGCPEIEVGLVEGALRVTRSRSPLVGLGWELRGVDAADLVAPVQAMIHGPAGGLGALHAGQLGHEALCGRPGSQPSLQLVDSAGAAHAVSLPRQAPEGATGSMGLLGDFRVTYEDALLANNAVGYVRFNLFMLPVPARFEESLGRFRAAGATGLIIDLRGNPGGLAGMAPGLAGWLIGARGQSLGVMVTREARLDLNIFPRPNPFTGKVAILVDGASASTSEIFAAGLQELGRAQVFGETSAGAALPSMFESLPNGDRMQLAMADLTTPKGYRVEGVGVRPDHLAPHTAQGLQSGHDAALDAALAWLTTPERP